MPDEPIKKNDHVEFRDAYDKWHRGVALTGIEPTHIDGRKVHDFPVIWVMKADLKRMPWPADDVRHAPPGVPDDWSKLDEVRQGLLRA